MIEVVAAHIIPAAYQLLPTRMSSPEATAILLTIGLQESRFQHRVQLPREAGGEPGPARGLWQFEEGGGVKGVLYHPASRMALRAALTALRYPPNPDTTTLHTLITHNDVLAAVCARLLLWTDYRPVPRKIDGPEAAWLMYRRTWRPGAPHREVWDACWAEGWRRALGD